MTQAAELEAATLRAAELYDSRGFQGAYIAGAHARIAGLTADACPYSRSRKGWRAWRKAWLLGHAGQ